MGIAEKLADAKSTNWVTEGFSVAGSGSESVSFYENG